MQNVINKSMDYQDLLRDDAQQIVKELNDLVLFMRQKKIPVSSWYGKFHLSGEPNSFEVINRGYDYKPLPGAIDDQNFPWFLYWEIAWVFLNGDFKPGQKVLDLGGSSSLFSYYLASKGLNVTTVDMNEELVDVANQVAKALNWPINNLAMDMRNLTLDQEFDHITSICVFEHIPMFDRISINEKLKELLKKDGFFSITVDYRNPSQAARISSPEDIDAQFVKPSGMKLRGNQYFFDNSKNYLLHPFFSPKIDADYKKDAINKGHFDHSLLGCTKDVNDYTFGALFFVNQ